MLKIRSLGIMFLCVVIGTVLGPIVVAAAQAALSPKGAITENEDEATRLIAVYRSRLSPVLLFVSMAPYPDGRECGYEPETLFPNRMETFGPAQGTEFYAQYEGYLALRWWIGQQSDRVRLRLLSSELHQHMTPFKIAFLRRCIEATLFSAMCMRQVESVAKRAVRQTRIAHTGLFAENDEASVLCSFLDGVWLRGAALRCPRSRETSQLVTALSRWQTQA